MPPLSYALLNEVLQYPPRPEERVSIDNNNNVAQNTNIIQPNKDIYKNIRRSYPNYDISSNISSGINNVMEFFTQSGSSVEELMREQIFLNKLILILLLFILLINLLNK